MSWVVVWTNPATREKSYAVVDQATGRFIWERASANGLLEATKYDEKGHASAFKRRLNGGLQCNVTVERV